VVLDGVSVVWSSSRFGNRLLANDARDGPVTLQGDATKEAQRADCLREITRGDVSLVNQIYLVLTNLFWPEQLRRLAEMPGEVSDAVGVDPDGVRRSIAYPQITIMR
jgi:hypothetical protein